MITKIRRSLLPGVLASIGVLPGCGPMLRAQTPLAAAAGSSLPLNAVLVLTPEFCKTVSRQGSMWTTGRESFKVGQMACTDLEPALKPAFRSLTVATAPPTSGGAQVVLVPKFAGTHATRTAFAFANRELDVMLEWRAMDSTGKTVWLQTVRGSSKHHMGNMFTHGHDVKLVVRDSVKAVAEQSATKMKAAAELRKLASAETSPGN